MVKVKMLIIQGENISSIKQMKKLNKFLFKSGFDFIKKIKTSYSFNSDRNVHDSLSDLNTKMFHNNI